MFRKPTGLEERHTILAWKRVVALISYSSHFFEHLIPRAAGSYWFVSSSVFASEKTHSLFELSCPECYGPKWRARQQCSNQCKDFCIPGICSLSSSMSYDNCQLRSWSYCIIPLLGFDGLDGTRSQYHEASVSLGKVSLIYTIKSGSFSQFYQIPVHVRCNPNGRIQPCSDWFCCHGSVQICDTCQCNA